MRNLAVVCILVILLGLVFSAQVVQATPTPPYLLVNHSTKECGQRWIADDCRSCEPLPGWEIVGMVSTNQCPEGYAQLHNVEMACTGYENPFCCSGGSHRGECKDMVVHDAEQVCAFVEEIEGCDLPEGWRQRPQGSPPGDWVCPYPSWEDELIPCTAGVPTVSAEPSETPPGPTVETTEDDQGNDSEKNTGPQPTVIALAAIILAILGAAILILCGVLIWVVARKSRT